MLMVLKEVLQLMFIIQGETEILSLENQVKGLYLIVITDNENVIGRQKVILK